MKTFWVVLRKSFDEWQNDRAFKLGASLSFYTVFSLPPLLVIVVAVAGAFFGEAAVQGKILEQFRGILGDKGAALVQTMLAGVNRGHSGLIAGLIGTAALLIGATAVFVDLQDSLNTIWKVKRKPGGGLLMMLKVRGLSVLLAVGTGVLLLALLVASALLTAFAGYLSEFWSGAAVFAVRAADVVVSFLVMIVLFAVLFKTLPDAHTDWRDIWPGASLTAFFSALGKFAIGIYLGRSSVGSVFGAAGSLALLFTWIYYFSQIFFFGAEFTHVSANTYGSGTRPKKHATSLGDSSRGAEGRP